MKQHALVYVRKSHVRYKRDEISPERQLANCLAAAEAHGWQVGDDSVYQDAEGHRSGRTEDHRPAWQALKARLTNDPGVVAVVVNSLDRSSRSPKDFFNFLDLVQQHDIEIVSVTEQFDTSTAIGRAFLAILMVVASLESDLASERTTSTIEYLKSQGKHWGQTPYGYTRDDNTIPQPDDCAPAVVAAMEHFAQGGHSYIAVARYLNNQGFRWKDRKGIPTPFTRYAVRSIISNVLIYAGWVPVGRGKDMQINDKAHSLRDLVQLTDASPGQHPPLIDEDLANAVLTVRQRRVRRSSKHSEKRLYILSPLLHCAACNQQLRGKAGRRTNTGPRYCHDATCADREGSHDAVALEEEVLALLDWKLSASVLQDLHEHVTSRAWAQPEHSALKKQLQGLQGRLARARELYLMGDYERDEYMVVRTGLLQEIEDIEGQVGRGDYPLESALSRINQLSDILKQGTPVQQKRALSLVFQKVFVAPEGNITRVQLQDWAQPFFSDLAELGDVECPQGTSVAIYVAILARL